MDNETLGSEISELLYLKEATEDEADNVAEKVHGFIYGQKSRLILPCVFSIHDC